MAFLAAAKIGPLDANKINTKVQVVYVKLLSRNPQISIPDVNKSRSLRYEMTNPHTCLTVKLLGLLPFANEHEPSAEECLNVD